MSGSEKYIYIICVSFCTIFMETTKWSVKMFDGPGTKAVWHVSDR